VVKAEAVLVLSSYSPEVRVQAVALVWLLHSLGQSRIQTKGHHAPQDPRSA